MNINELILTLSQSKMSLPTVDREYCNSHDIWTNSIPLPFYVEPDLSGAETLSPVLLISAPAAVGKTTLARHLHDKLLSNGQGALYIPLQYASIGQDFFTGRLAGVFPYMSKRDFLDAVFQGQIILIFDGYDEVTMRSDQIERNKYFIEEINRELDSFISRGGIPKTSIIFLFRSVFADFGVFDALSSRASQIFVNFFDKVKRNRFLEEYLNVKASRDVNGRPSKGHLSSAFLDGFESTLSKAKDQAAAFFGHAIVLSAFGDFLHEQEEKNAAKLAQDLTGSETIESTAVTLLSRIISNILEREVEKFPRQEYISALVDFEPYSTHVQELLLCGAAEDELFRRATQSSNAIARAIHSAVSILVSHNDFLLLDEADREKLRDNYRSELTSRMMHHPFIDVRKPNEVEFRNPIYREYYLARLISDSPGRNWDLVARANEHSHYLGLFFLSSVNARDISGYEGFIFPLISLLATSSSGSEFLFQLKWNLEDCRWVGQVQAPYLHIDSFFISDPILTLSVPPQGVLQNISIEGGEECLLEISGPSHELANSGPIILRDCFFEADDISLNASAIKFERVSVSCNKFCLNDLVSSFEGYDSLSIKSIKDDIIFSMSDYARGRWGDSLKAVSNESGAKGEYLFRRKLSKMLLGFRKHGRSEYGIYDMKLQTYVFSGNKDKESMELANFFFHKKFFSRNGSLVVMDQDSFAKYDIYYEKQNEIKFGQKSSNLFNELISSQYGFYFRGVLQ